MRLYTFCNCYLSSIQQGIQSAHILGELVNNHILNSFAKDEHRIITECFLKNHKTMIVCNGGNNKMLLDLISYLDDARNPYPVACFHEDEDSLCGSLTGVGIILPEKIYDAKLGVLVHDDTEYKFYEHEEHKWFEDEYEYELIKRVKSYRLAN